MLLVKVLAIFVWLITRPGRAFYAIVEKVKSENYAWGTARVLAIPLIIAVLAAAAVVPSMPFTLFATIIFIGFVVVTMVTVTRDEKVK